MIFLKKTMLCIGTTMFLVNGYSQKNPIDSLKARVTTLENYKENIEQLYTISAEKLSKHVDEEVNKKADDIDESKKILKLLLFLGIPGTIIGLIGVYFGTVRKAKKIIVTRIENIVEQKREELIKLIETQEYDTKLKNTKRLLVLSSSNEASEALKPTFEKLKFKKVNFRSATSYVEHNDYDLIIFNDSDSSFDPDLINEYVQNTVDQNLSFVVYTNRSLVRNPRINFCNSSFTLYHNILSTLKYTEILKVI